MEQETLAFGLSFLALATGLIVLLAGIFQGGLTTLALAGGAIGAIGVIGLYAAAARA